jgi:hypothetical protein
MRSVLLDGESKVGKTSVSNAIASNLSSDYRVEVADAGAFFRRMTVGVFDWLEVQSAVGVPAAEVDEALAKILAEGIPYDNNYPFGDLERKEVGDFVSNIGRRALSQRAAEEWFAVTAERARAADTEVLVMNARNPRARLAGIDVGVCLELIVKCDPEIAGYRAAVGLGFANPTEAQVKAQTAKVIERRTLDRTRLPEDNPYLDPPFELPFTLGASPSQRVIEVSWVPLPACSSIESSLPHPIEFDTSRMQIDEMRLGVQALARSALAFTA